MMIFAATYAALAAVILLVIAHYDQKHGMPPRLGFYIFMSIIGPVMAAIYVLIRITDKITGMDKEAADFKE